MKSKINHNSLKNYLVAFLGITLAVQSALAASGMFPKMPAATNVYVVDCQNDSEDARMTAWALQGLVNQSLAEVYIIEKERPRHLEQLKDCGKPFEILEPLAGNNAGLRTLFKKYQGRVKKMILYDPKKDWTGYLALMAAAQQGGIPVTESVENDLKSEFNWKGDVEDFRNKWNDKIEAYEWALSNLMPGCNKQVIFALWIPLSLIDYVVASKGFILGLDFYNTERVEIEKIFRTQGYGVGTSLMGYRGDDANKVANRYGIGYVVSDIYANGSFWSSFPDKTYKQTPGRAISAVPGKVYVAITWSDGDNLQFDQNALWNLWRDPARGAVPVGTTSSPSLQELNTPLLDWFYAHMTANDELVAYGIQFIYGDDFDDNLFPAWCKLNRSWMEDAGFQTGFLWHTTYPSLKYTTYINTCGLTGILNAGGGTWIRYDTGTPVMDEGRASWNPNDIFDWLSKVPRQRTPVFIGFKCIVAGYTKDGMNAYTKIKQQVDRLDAAYPGRFVFLLPKDLFATIRNYCHLGKTGETYTDISVITGLPGTDEGLTPVNAGDGGFKIIDHEGTPCWLLPKHTPPRYFYLAKGRGFRLQPHADLEIELEYLDVGSGDIVLDYDSSDIRAAAGGAYKTHPHAVHRTNTALWKSARFKVGDALFAGRQNAGADFCFYNGGDDLLIRAVRVRHIEP